MAFHFWQETSQLNIFLTSAHVITQKQQDALMALGLVTELKELVGHRRFERLTCRLEGGCSIQLS